MPDGHLTLHADCYDSLQLQHGADASLKDKLNRVALHCIPDGKSIKQCCQNDIIVNTRSKEKSNALVALFWAAYSFNSYLHVPL